MSHRSRGAGRSPLVGRAASVAQRRCGGLVSDTGAMKKLASMRVAIALALGSLLLLGLLWWVHATLADEFEVVPEIVTGFAATFYGFLVALYWERHRERARAIEDERSRQAARVTDARRRFHAMLDELERNERSLKLLSGGLRGRLAHPELLSASWDSSRQVLAGLVSDYDLLADLAAFHGRIEELRWRLRMRTTMIGSVVASGADPWSHPIVRDLDTMTEPLITELGPELESILGRTREQAANPTVPEHGLLHVDSGTVVIGIGAAAESAVE